MDLVTDLQKKGILHIFEWNQEGFIFDSTSNSVFSCSLQDIKEISGGFVSLELVNEIKELQNEGYFLEEANLQFEDRRICKSLCLMITRDCNFRCPYCFEKGKSSLSKQKMDKKTAKKALEFLVETSGSRKYLECDFFGGEPLLYWDIVQYVIEESAKLAEQTGKKFRFSLTTNASLLTPPMVQYLWDHNISLILSQDGLPQNHNRFRIKEGGAGTYNEVMEAIQLVTDNWDEGYYVRGTYTKENLQFSDDVKHLYSKGIKKISFEPVVSDNPKIGFTENDISFLRVEYQKFTEWYLDTLSKDPSFSFYHFEVDLKQGACKEKLMTSCGAGVEYASVSPEGDLYPCHQFDGVKEYKLGSIWDGFTNKAIQDTFRNATNLLSKEECRTCWARYICGGGCSANNLRMNNQLTSSWEIGCKIQKARIEAALYVQAKKGCK